MTSLKIFLVSILVLGYAALITYCSIVSWSTEGIAPFGEPLTYIANGLCGLIGGIVAAGFGVSLPKPFREETSRYNRKMISLGHFIMTWKLRIDKEIPEPKQLFGIIYAWVYMIAGIAAIVVWVKVGTPHPVIVNIATISFGLILVVVKNYFDG
jgi:hypothetical protein